VSDLAVNATFYLIEPALLAAPPVSFGAIFLMRRRWPHVQSVVAATSAGVFFLILLFVVLRISFADFLVNCGLFAIGYLALCLLIASCGLISHKATRITMRIVTVIPILVGYVIGTGGLLGLIAVLSDYTPRHTEQMDKNLYCEISSWGMAFTDGGYDYRLYKTWDGIPFLRRKVESIDVDENQDESSSCADALAAYRKESAGSQ